MFIGRRGRLRESAIGRQRLERIPPFGRNDKSFEERQCLLYVSRSENEVQDGLQVIGLREEIDQVGLFDFVSGSEK